MPRYSVFPLYTHNEPSESLRICPNCVFIRTWSEVNAGRHLRCHPRPVLFASDLERSRAPTASVTSTYETDGPLVGDSEKATAKEGSPRIEDSHLPRHPTDHSSLLFPDTLLPCVLALLSSLFSSSRRPVDLSIYLAIYIHVILHRGHDGDY